MFLPIFVEPLNSKQHSQLRPYDENDSGKLDVIQLTLMPGDPVVKRILVGPMDVPHDLVLVVEDVGHLKDAQRCEDVAERLIVGTELLKKHFQFHLLDSQDGHTDLSEIAGVLDGFFEVG